MAPQCLFMTCSRSGHHLALGENISPNKVLREKHVKDQKRERKHRNTGAIESQHSGKETDRAEHARRQN